MKMSRTQKVILGAIGVIIIFALIGLIAGGGQEEPQSQAVAQSQDQHQQQAQEAVTVDPNGTQDESEIRAAGIEVGIDTPDGRIGCGEGFRVDDESEGAFTKAGIYKINAADDLKLDIAGRETINLPAGEDVFVTVAGSLVFKIHNWFDAGFACIWPSSEAEEAAAAAAKAEEEAERVAEEEGAGRGAAEEEAEGNAAEKEATRQSDAEEQQTSAHQQPQSSKEDLEPSQQEPNQQERQSEVVQEEDEAVVDQRTDQEIAEACLSLWDGNHDDFERQVRELLNDPDSMETHSTRFGTIEGQFFLIMDYGARNAFGGMVRTEAIAIMDTETCEVFVLDYGFE